MVAMVDLRYGGGLGVSPATLSALWMAHLLNIIHRRHGDPACDPRTIAQAANMSPRLLYRICRDAGTTPMRLVKQVRLQACRASLHDPAAEAMTVRDVHTSHGYDRFSRDFRRHFGVLPAAGRDGPLQHAPPVHADHS